MGFHVSSRSITTSTSSPRGGLALRSDRELKPSMGVRLRLGSCLLTPATLLPYYARPTNRCKSGCFFQESPALVRLPRPWPGTRDGPESGADMKCHSTRFGQTAIVFAALTALDGPYGLGYGFALRDHPRTRTTRKSRKGGRKASARIACRLVKAQSTPRTCIQNIWNLEPILTCTYPVTPYEVLLNTAATPGKSLRKSPDQMIDTG